MELHQNFFMFSADSPTATPLILNMDSGNFSIDFLDIQKPLRTQVSVVRLPTSPPKTFHRGTPVHRQLRTCHLRCTDLSWPTPIDSTENLRQQRPGAPTVFAGPSKVHRYSWSWDFGVTDHPREVKPEVLFGISHSRLSPPNTALKGTAGASAFSTAWWRTYLGAPMPSGSTRRE